MKAGEVLGELRKNSNPENLEGMRRFGIKTEKALAVRIPVLRKLAKQVGKDHGLAADLWNSEIHEARILAGMIDNPEKVTLAQMESWVSEFDSWDLCDQVCSNLFDRTLCAHEKAIDWSQREEEFVKRAGFVLMATSAVHNKKADDNYFRKFFPSIKKGSYDERNFVKKAVNWAIRQIGKRNSALRLEAIKLSEEISEYDSKAARWIANDALRELRRSRKE